MPALNELLASVVFPPLYGVTRQYNDDALTDIPGAVWNSLGKNVTTLPVGAEIAVAVGSRGIANLPLIVKSVVSWFVSRGCRPFIVPAMGSHGGATAEGQRHMLEHLGITETSVGCPIRATMDVEQIGTTDNGLPVFMDAYAARAGGVFVINRIKAHTAFTGPHESGLAKMLVIGLGKRHGAEVCHGLGFGHFAELMPAMAHCILTHMPSIIGGLAIVENASDHTCLVEAVPRQILLERDQALLSYARQRMGTLPVTALDVLLVQRMGKNISGSGMDSNVTGRAPTPYKTGSLTVTQLGVLRLTEESRGNAIGLGNADVTTRRLVESIDFNATYTNVMTSTALKAAAVPVVMPTDEAALRCLLKTANTGSRPVRLIFIRDTLTLDRFWVSPALTAELARHPECVVDSQPQHFRFAQDGSLLAPVWNP